MFAVRGTRLTKTGTVQADIQLLRDRDAELYYSQRALKHVQKHIRRLSAEQPDVQWGFFITGVSPHASPLCSCLSAQSIALRFLQRHWSLEAIAISSLGTRPNEAL